MDNPAGTSFKLCPHCKKSFANNAYMNRHIKRVHKIGEVANSTKKKSHILCPLCKDEEKEMKTYEYLNKHLEEYHKEYEAWKDRQKLETNYAMHRINQYKDYKEKHYECNKSNTRGYESKYCKRTDKSGGTIKMHGVCPSKCIIKFYHNGEKVDVTFWQTHVGHDEGELRSTHLSTVEKNMVVEKLKSGVPSDRILEDARKLETLKLERINLLSRKDVSYLSTKHNIEKRRDKNEMVAAALKVEEWNAHGKNFAFFFKQEGETHDVLEKGDFALGFMNATMEEKLKNFPTIICMDGTHSTNKKGMDLTIMLIKDDKNAGFPVAFFLSNRLDQQVQEVFLGALRQKIQQEIKPQYFMSDDDPKYYNAWKKMMGNTPKRLLCTWHVVKNWNIQGRNKIKDPEIKKQMKNEMKKILNETNEEKFIKLCNTYLGKLLDANEVKFVIYLLKFYFQRVERIHMWAHCYRKNAGINTNMAIESLNNLLKTNQLKRKSRITIEKLLDTIEDLVDIKMWQRILNMERPNANNYQDRIIIKAHKKAEATKNNVEVIETQAFGEFQVKSSTGENFYNINFKEVCESECRTLYCRVCKICIHRYQCDCPQYMVKNTMCKHVHLVRMYEERKGTNFVSDSTAKALGEHSKIRAHNEQEIAQFVEDKMKQQETAKVDKPSEVAIRRAYIHNLLDNLDDETFEKIAKKIEEALKEDNQRKNKAVTSKRKMEKQEYFPTKKT